jgi:hypothetical protein
MLVSSVFKDLKAQVPSTIDPTFQQSMEQHWLKQLYYKALLEFEMKRQKDAALIDWKYWKAQLYDDSLDKRHHGIVIRRSSLNGNESASTAAATSSNATPVTSLSSNKPSASINKQPPPLPCKDPAVATAKQLSNARKQASIIAETISTEKTYFDLLKLLKKYYIDPLKQSNSDLGLSQSDIHSIFANVDEFIRLHEIFYEALQQRYDDEMGSDISGARALGNAFKKIGSFLKIYTQYVSLKTHTSHTFCCVIVKSYTATRSA